MKRIGQQRPPRRVSVIATAAFLALAGGVGQRSLAGAAETPSDSRATGVHHVVAAGQTLWRIGKVYGVSLGELQRVNGIDDPTRVEVGTALWVPGVDNALRVPPFPEPLPSAGGTPAPPRSVGLTFVWPVENGAVTSYYGAPRRGRRHAGVDIRGRRGQKVRAAADGTVVYSGSSMRGYGRTVIVDHGGGISTLYAHNSRLLVRVGQRVRSGQPIARVGKTGNASTEHCHFEIRDRDVRVDPLRYFNGGAR
jgi:LysM repeat protein